MARCHFLLWRRCGGSFGFGAKLVELVEREFQISRGVVVSCVISITLPGRVRLLGLSKVNGSLLFYGLLKMFGVRGRAGDPGCGVS